MRFFRPLPIFCAFVFLASGIVLAVWSSQWWLPKLAPALLDQVAVKIDSAERIENGRMRLQGLRYEGDDGMLIEADFIAVPNLWNYIQARWLSTEWSETERIELGAVAFQLGAEAKTNNGSVSDVDLPAIMDQLDKAVSEIGRWMPPVSVREFRILDSEGDPIAGINNLAFAERKLEASISTPTTTQVFPVVLFLQSGAWSLELSAPEYLLELEASLDRSGEQVLLHGSLSHAGRPVHFEASWKSNDVMPQKAKLQAKDVVIADQLIKKMGLKEVEQLRLANMDIQWEDERYSGSIEVDVKSELAGHSNQSIGVIAFEGDTQKIRILNVDIESPWAQAKLDAPLTIRIPELTFEEEANFKVSADLSGQPFLPIGGTLEGHVFLTKSGSPRFALSVRSIAYEGYPKGDVMLRGTINQAEVDFEKIGVVIHGATASEVEAKGRVDFQKKYLNIECKGSVSPELLKAIGLQEQIQKTVQFEGVVDGEIADPKWSINCQVPDLRIKGMPSLAVKGSVSGKGVRSARIDAAVINEQEQVHLALQIVKTDSETVEGSFEDFLWEAGDALRYELVQPSSFILPLSGSAQRMFQELVIGKFVLSGPATNWSLEKVKAGPLYLSAHGLRTGWLDYWVNRKVPDYGLQKAELRLTQLSPFIDGELSLKLTDASSEYGDLSFDLDKLQFGERTNLRKLEVALGKSPAIVASGSAPFKFEWPESEVQPTLRFAKKGPIEAQARVEPSQTLSDLILRMSGLAVNSPRLHLELTGSIEEPEGRLEAAISSIGFQGVFNSVKDVPKIPDLEEIELLAELDTQNLVVSKLSGRISGSKLNASGRWPEEELRELALGKEADMLAALQSGAYELVLSEWKLENWEPYLPAMLRRTGTLNGKLKHDPVSGFVGDLRVSDVGLRPTQNLPSVDSIEGSLRLSGRKLVLEQSGARVGGSPVSLEGNIDFSDWPQTEWKAQIKGKNVPVVRRPEMILRSDLDLNLVQELNEAPQLSGRLGLRSSTMLVEFDPLSPTVRSGPSTTPPFFSVEESPFDQWGLDIRIEGERFLRVRSPYFRAVLSGGFDLAGRLGEPLLLGSVRIDEGTLTFPGTKMRLDSGEAYIESARPNTLQLDITGAARTGTHVITMDVSGSTADPHIQFDATPPLPNASVVRLLSTGSTSGGGAGSVGLYLGRGLLGAGGMNESFADRVTIDLAEEKTRSGKSTVGVRYDISDELYLQGEYDVYDSYNTDLVWTIFEK